ncbi:SPASM domain-containing protein [Actinosynnema sp. NPDC050436]|uniref:SPASM domain-containing protein n=1 Tax=Actinosynnema sp. NPDC050436 TaxID=3155659 RepID=UPI003411428D
MPDASQLCGQCGRGSAAIAPDGRVWPCVFSRWLTTGNVREESLAEILGGQRWREATAALARQFDAAGKPPAPPCDPRCGPNCGPACSPSCRPTGAGPCGPRGGCQPNYD